MSEHDNDVMTALRAMWADMKGLHRAFNERLDVLTERVDGIDRHLVDSEIRIATELLAVAAAVRELRDVLRARGQP